MKRVYPGAALIYEILLYDMNSRYMPVLCPDLPQLHAKAALGDPLVKPRAVEDKKWWVWRGDSFWSVLIPYVDISGCIMSQGNSRLLFQSSYNKGVSEADSRKSSINVPYRVGAKIFKCFTGKLRFAIGYIYIRCLTSSTSLPCW